MFEVVIGLSKLMMFVIRLFNLIVGLFVVPFYIWAHYDRLKTRSAEMAAMAREKGMRLEQAMNRRLHKTYRFLRKVGSWKKYALNVISTDLQGHSVTMFEYHYQTYFDCEVWEYNKWIQHYYVSSFVLDLE